ncbi:MAG: hypothetical protein CL669_03870 [Balneola sp.]|nr:hypothetical protein [Balneola sp.]|tara:strand:- start:234 stop:452 length:219 start_codon:yes stop_codon:yes gene_type:complete
MQPDTFLDKCLSVLRREDVRVELKSFMKPIFDMILQELYPYIYLSVLLVVVSFLLMVAIFIMIVKSKSKLAA